MSRRVQQDKKIVVIGAPGVGKSTLLQTIAQSRFCKPIPNVPTVQHTMYLDDKAVVREFDDLLSHASTYEKRAKAYDFSRAVIICYSIDDPESLSEVITRWAPEITSYSKYMPIVLVATKCDLRTEPEQILKLERQGKSLITSSQGEKLAEKIGARMYVECSCRSYKGVDKLASIAMRITLKSVPKPSSGCIVS